MVQKAYWFQSLAADYVIGLNLRLTFIIFTAGSCSQENLEKHINSKVTNSQQTQPGNRMENVRENRKYLMNKSAFNEQTQNVDLLIRKHPTESFLPQELDDNVWLHFFLFFNAHFDCSCRFYSIILPNLRVQFKLCLSYTHLCTQPHTVFSINLIILTRLRVTLPPSGHSTTHTHSDNWCTHRWSQKGWRMFRPPQHRRVELLQCYMQINPNAHI